MEQLEFTYAQSSHTPLATVSRQILLFFRFGVLQKGAGGHGASDRVE